MRYGRSVKVMKMICWEMSSGFWLGEWCCTFSGCTAGYDGDVMVAMCLQGDCFFVSVSFV